MSLLLQNKLDICKVTTHWLLTNCPQNVCFPSSFVFLIQSHVISNIYFGTFSNDVNVYFMDKYYLKIQNDYKSLKKSLSSFKGMNEWNINYCTFKLQLQDQKNNLSITE